jgi:hypothetical protein
MSNDKISEYQKEGYLIIKDSLKAYSSRFHDNNTAWNINTRINQKAENSGNNCVTVIADLGSFFHHNLGDTQRLVDYELSLLSRIPCWQILCNVRT